MRAESCLRKPGDAAQRESDGAVAVRRLDVTAEGDALSGSCVFMQPKRQPDYYTHVNSISGEDWQPLVTAEGEFDKWRGRFNNLISQEDDLLWAEIYHEVALWQKIVGDHEAESHYWYTADGEIEILDSPEEVVRRRKEAAKRLVELESQIATLTAELEKARSGEAWVGERIQWGDIDAGELFLAEHTGEPRLQYCVKFSEVVADVCPNATAFYECHLPPVPRTEWRDGETVYFHGDSAMEPLIAWIDMIDRKLDQGRDGKTLSGEGRRLIKALKAIVASVAAEEAAPLPPAEPTPEEAGEELSNETCERILEMVLDKRFDDAYMLPLGSRITIGKRAWTLRERDAGHPDYMHFDETTVGESYPQKRIMYPSEVQWCLDNGCKVVLPEPVPAKPEHKGNDYIQWVAHNRYQLTSIGAAALVSLLRDPELAAAIEKGE